MKRIAMLLMLLAALPAHADSGTDYTCLKACLTTNAPYSSCQPKCSYDTSSSGAALALHTSYSCLRDCVNGGGAAPVCVPMCTEEPAAFAAPVRPTHNQFTAPQPLDQGAIVMPEKALKPDQTPKTTDYGCMKLCTQGLQYPLCEQRCTRTDGDKIVSP